MKIIHSATNQQKPGEERRAEDVDLGISNKSMAREVKGYPKKMYTVRRLRTESSKTNI